MARSIGLSPQAFCRFFRSKSGRSFQQYANELRVVRACSSLRHPEEGIADIVFRSEFNNLSNFNRRFREIVGRTPREYRRIHANDE